MKSASALSLLLVALALVACGGGSDSSNPGAENGSQGASGAAGNGTGGATAQGGSKAAQGGESKRPGAVSIGNSKGSGGSTSGGGSNAHNDSGGGATQFETHGGDNSIQEFGGEAGGSELDQAAAALHAYLDARAAEEWGRACDSMASGVSESLQQLAAGGPSGGSGNGSKKMTCADILSGLSAGLPPSALREAAQADVGALRVEGERAFLLYHGAHDTGYFMPMAKEGGEWKVAALAASALP